MDLQRQLQLCHKPLLGLSQCLSGAKVRYDGRDKHHPAYQGWLTELFQLLPFCPEMAIGLGTPRPAIRLQKHQQQIQVIEPVSGQDFSQALALEAKQLQRQYPLAGFVLTTKSPSCGLGSTKIHNNAGEIIARGNGIFAHHLDPQLALIEDVDLDEPRLRQAFIKQAYLRQYYLENSSSPIPTAFESIEWTQY